MKEITKIFVANRGEIAIRVIKTAREMGIYTVTVHTPNDKGSLHVKLADKSVLLERNSLDKTFLSVDKMVEIAVNEGCDAIHPGYGFISEDSEFPRRCEQKGLAFIGPSADTIGLMGNKVKARSFVKSLGIPVISGLHGDVEELLVEANYLDFPVMVKPLAGGGGKGIFIVHEKSQLEQTLYKASREALSYFNNSELYIEKYFTHARHIEVQLLGDMHGNLVHLYDRECSLQRRYQKIIEEAPSPSITGDLRKKLIKAAVTIGKAVGYFSAGTIEFLVDHEENFYFLEMNTRIQVEHGVSELVTGIDIVKEQVRVASGRKVSKLQKNIHTNGHAIESRLYAEDPLNNFRPSQGAIKLCKFPEGENIRVDTHLSEGLMLPETYDSLLAKIMVKGKTRGEAIDRLENALLNTSLIGVKNNLLLLRLLVSDTSFKRANVHTKYIKEFLSASKVKFEQIGDEGITPVAIAYLGYHFLNKPKTSGNIWQGIGFWRHQQQVEIKVNAERVLLGWDQKPGFIEVVVNNNRILLQKLQIYSNQVMFQVQGKVFQLSLFEDAGCTFIQYNGMVFKTTSQHIINHAKINKEHEAEANREKNILSPLYGKVINITCTQGEKKKKGEVLAIVESMKIENNIISPGDVIIEKVHVGEGQQVTEGEVLVSMQPATELEEKVETH